MLTKGTPEAEICRAILAGETVKTSCAIDLCVKIMEQNLKFAENQDYLSEATEVFEKLKVVMKDVLWMERQGTL